MNERTLTLFLFLSGPSFRSFSSQECAFPQESCLLSLFLSPLQSLFPPRNPLSFQPSFLGSVRSTGAPLCATPLLNPFTLSLSSPFPSPTLSSSASFFLPRPRPRSLSYSPFPPRGEQKLRIREAFVESHGASIEGFRSAVLAARQPRRFNHGKSV